MTVVNGKRLLTKKYAAWRVLQAPGAWAQVYIDRYKALKDYSGVIVFPEQLLGVHGNVFRVRFDGTAHNCGVNITLLPNVELYCFTSMLGPVRLKTVDEVYEFEHRNQDRGDLKMLKLASDQNASDFSNGLLFSNKRSAIRWSAAFLERSIS